MWFIKDVMLLMKLGLHIAAHQAARSRPISSIPPVWSALLRRFVRLHCGNLLARFLCSLFLRLAAPRELSPELHLELGGDERSPLRGDINRLGLAAFALSGATVVTPDAGARFAGGQDTTANRERWWAASHALNVLTITIDPKTGEWRNLAVVDVRKNGDVVLCAPVWWRGEERWRLAGGLFRPILGNTSAARGMQLGYWGSLHRTVASFEAVLSYGTSAGRGRDGRIPDTLRPDHARKSGPGPWVFIPWLDVLRRAGEHIDLKASRGSAEPRRWTRRRNALIDAGYKPAADNTAAPAEDTIEVKDQRGGKGRQAGLWIRASARFVEATRKARDDRRGWTRLAASQVFRKTD